jgi:hypothetical protein
MLRGSFLIALSRLQGPLARSWALDSTALTWIKQDFAYRP